VALDIIKRYFFLTDSCSTGYVIPDQKAVRPSVTAAVLTVVL